MAEQLTNEIKQRIESARPTYHDLVERDIIKAFRSPKATFVLKVSPYYYEDGTLAKLLCLSGTVACNYKKARYNIPVEIWFQQDYPEVPPLVFVRPTSGMYITPVSEDVQPNGTLIIPYLKNWNHPHSDMADLLEEMSYAFGVNSPVFANPIVTSSQSSSPESSSLFSSLALKEHTPVTETVLSNMTALPSTSNVTTSVTYGSSSSAATSNIGEQNQHTHRFSDIAAEPLTILLPIQGYEKMPIVPLEEAIVPLVSLVEDVGQMVWIAKQKCINPQDGLSSDESAAIMLYTMEWEPYNKSFYVALNNVLRAARRDELKPWFSYLRLTINALQKLPRTNRTVYRGVNGNLTDQYRRGQTIIWWGFSSCTKSIEALGNKRFLDKSGSRTLFSIECESGKSIRSHSFYEDEDEILLLPARQFEVMGCLDQGNGLQIVQLKEIDPKFPLLKLPLS